MISYHFFLLSKTRPFDFDELSRAITEWLCLNGAHARTGIYLTMKNHPSSVKLFMAKNAIFQKK
jgi:hypothetical protein